MMGWQDGCRYSPPEGSVFTSYLGLVLGSRKVPKWFVRPVFEGKILGERDHQFYGFMWFIVALFWGDLTKNMGIISMIFVSMIYIDYTLDKDHFTNHLMEICLALLRNTHHELDKFAPSIPVVGPTSRISPYGPTLGKDVVQIVHRAFGKCNTMQYLFLRLELFVLSMTHLCRKK